LHIKATIFAKADFFSEGEIKSGKFQGTQVFTNWLLRIDAEKMATFFPPGSSPH
jgi:hypothetical protein